MDKQLFLIKFSVPCRQHWRNALIYYLHVWESQGQAVMKMLISLRGQAYRNLENQKWWKKINWGYSITMLKNSFFNEKLFQIHGNQKFERWKIILFPYSPTIFNFSKTKPNLQDKMCTGTRTTAPIKMEDFRFFLLHLVKLQKYFLEKSWKVFTKNTFR